MTFRLWRCLCWRPPLLSHSKYYFQGACADGDVVFQGEGRISLSVEFSDAKGSHQS